jgi:hypothetical protein
MRRLIAAAAVAAALTLVGCSRTHATKIKCGLALDFDTWPASPSPHVQDPVAVIAEPESAEVTP